MRFTLLWVGKTRNKHWQALQEENLQRLSHFARFEIVEVKDGGGKEAEGKRILQKLNQSSLVCLLDVSGKSLSSVGLARELEKWQQDTHKEITLVIGGADGVARSVADRADTVLSLSFLTFTHEMVRVVMLEQLYRAYTIVKGYPYQK
jgi:23S rRNA (pseudouridine1915-N3)-methyltransferase